MNREEIELLVSLSLHQTSKNNLELEYRDFKYYTLSTYTCMCNVSMNGLCSLTALQVTLFCPKCTLRV